MYRFASVPSATLTPERFIKAFIAELVLRGITGVPPRDPATRLGFARVVDLLDERSRELRSAGASLSEREEWVESANQLRLSPTGGVENWERALRAAQLTFTMVGNPDYELVSFTIDKDRARSELDRLSGEQQSFVREAAGAFEEERAAAE